MSSIYKLYLRTKIENLSPDSWLYKFKKLIIKYKRLLKYGRRFRRLNPYAKVCCIDAPSLNTIGSDEPRQILLLKLDHIGDFLTALDAFKLVRDAFPDAVITLVCLPSVVTMAESTKLFEIVIGFDGAHDSSNIGKVAVVRSSIMLEKFKSLVGPAYWLAMDLRHDFDTRKFLGVVNAEHKAGFIGHGDTRLDIALPNMEHDVSFQELSDGHLPPHNSLRLKLLVTTAISVLRAGPDFNPYFQSDETPSSPAYARLESSSKFKLGVCLGAGAELKAWPLDYWIQFLTAVTQDRPTQLVLFGGKVDRGLTDILKQSMPGVDFIDLVGALGLPETPTYLRQLDFYIGCDTGMTHFAAGLGLPTLSIFSGVAGLPIWRPEGVNVRTLYVTVPCAPCHMRFHNDCINNHLCIKMLTPVVVASHFREMLSRSAAAA